MPREVWVFCYGSYMNLDVLREVDFVPERTEVGRLAGFDLVIAPLANLVRSEECYRPGGAADPPHPPQHQ